MSLANIRKAHLQYAFTFMITPLPPQQLFSAETLVFPSFLRLLDDKATCLQAAVAKSRDVEPSCFGETVLAFAQQDFITGKNALLPRIVSEFDPDAKMELERASIQLFLNLAGWYIAVLFAANGFKSPYMPQSWIEKFKKDHEALRSEQREKYFEGIVTFLSESEAKWLMYPYLNIAGRLGQGGVETLLLTIGMFRSAAEKPQNMRGELPRDGKNAPKLSPEVQGFLQTLNLEGFGKNGEA